MRRNDRQCTELIDILMILNRCHVLRLGMVDGGKPYIVPLNFGYRMQGQAVVFYFHSAKEGRKLDILRQNPVVCVELDCDHALVSGDCPCHYSFRFRSILAEGIAQEVTKPADKVDALRCILQHQTGKLLPLAAAHTDPVSVWRVTTTTLTAKAHI